MLTGDSPDLNTDTLFHALIATAVDGIIVIDSRGLVQVYNFACEQLFGYAAAEVAGQNVKMLMPAPYHEEHDGYLGHYRQTGEKKIIGIGREVVGRRKDGSEFPMYLSVGEGRVAGERVFVGIIHDLTAIRGETALRDAANRHLAQIVQSSEDAIISKTLDGRITSWNNGAKRIFGFTAAEAIGQHISLLIPLERMDEEERIVVQLRAGRDIEHYETVRRRKDGAEIQVSLSVSPIRDGDGKVIGASKIARDITEKKQAEARTQALQSELAHVARLSAMGQMTAGIAHEVNQPLTAITNYVNAARRTLASATASPGDGAVGRAQDMLEKAALQTIRAGGIIRNLRGFVEKREGERAPENLNTVVEESIALAFAGAADSNIRLTIDLAKTLPPVLIDRIQIQQVLVNLIRNAIEAMAKSKTRSLSLETGPDGDGFAQVTVADTGSGLPPEVVLRLFQPFVTTKEKGMGIGLSICHSIVDGHGGRIWVLPEITTGTAFRVRLPLATNDEVVE
jgi:two-component system sensor kinase FixL